MLALLLVASGTVHAWRTAHHLPGIDFYQYWVVGKVVGRGEVPSIYEHSSRAALGQEFMRRALADGSGRERAAAQFRSVLEPISTPFLFTTLSPFSLGRYDASLDAFLALSLVSLLASVFILGRIVGLPPLECLLLLGFLVFAFQPVASDLRVGTVGQLQLGMLGLYAWLSANAAVRRQFAAGVALAAAIAFKPNLVAIPPLLLASWVLGRQWRRLTVQGSGMLVGAAIAVVVSCWFFGSFYPWRDWLAAMRELPSMAVEAGNVSPLSVFERWLGIQLGPLPAVALALATLAALLVRRRHVLAAVSRPVIEDLPVAATGCVVFMLSSPLVWLHYLILTVPGVMLLLRSQPPRRWLAVAAFVAIAMDPLDDILGLSDPVVRALAVIAGLLVLFALLVVEIATPTQSQLGQ